MGNFLSSSTPLPGSPDPASKSKLQILLRANHRQNSVLVDDNGHNYLPHHLGSVYLLGAPPARLFQVYDVAITNTQEWKDPGLQSVEISPDWWKDNIGDKVSAYQYFHFFGDEVVHCDYDWKAVVKDYLLKDNCFLLKSLIEGECHPLIHLGYAFELDSFEVAVEALTLAAVCVNFIQPVFSVEMERYQEPEEAYLPAMDVLKAIGQDQRFNGLFEKPDQENLKLLLEEFLELMLEHYRDWDWTKTSLEGLFDIAVHLYAGTHSSTDFAPKFNLSMLQMVTAAHATRICSTMLPSNTLPLLIRELFFAMCLHYITQLRPAFHDDVFEKYDTEGRGWEEVYKSAVNGEGSKDAHFVQVVRALRDAEQVYGAKGGFYLKAALMTVDHANKENSCTV
ncbi:hypothetical protein SAICODRAFT_19941 [Saitoella complicata NRRL Y-17804]|uniref:uncharacterized protein n=1 Tax=Saitoella complicata (strain BCRC 22490 / CBS 7301 / JCM 7358 / NBRC 10748 / NRRL Y-17804) TaxID=698492 RepID=UPI0008680A36|nr:uncharacterized protein SAICODRAFT_19941 [Saitoella complicata NRRL Y-17804]ODQ52379.1 hypothetical protein SAICODRAFT_19941 [Saitoella complicata NRRL Y-17804]